MEQKKRSVGATERDEWLRAAWRALVAGGLDADRLVFVDEMGANTSLAPPYAWARRGERAPAKVPRNWGANVTLPASMGREGMGPCLAVPEPRRPRTATTGRRPSPAAESRSRICLTTTSRPTKGWW